MHPYTYARVSEDCYRSSWGNYMAEKELEKEVVIEVGEL